jgi:hypothetical protein
MSSRRRDLQNQRTSSFHIPMADADKAGYGGEVPDLPAELPVMPKTTLAHELQQENKVLQKELEDLRTQLQSRTSALSVQDGTLMVHDFRFTPKGLIAPPNMNPESWEQVGNLLFKLEGSIQWLIGDWLVYGEDLDYGDIPKIAKAMGKDEKTLRNYMSISRAVKMSERHDQLSYGHHEVIMKLKLPGEQKEALAYAAEHELSVAAFRKLVRGNETIEVNEISEYDATPSHQIDNTAQQYSVDIAHFSPAKPNMIKKQSANDRREIARRARWLIKYYKALLKATGEKE